jgi:heptosyltransferase-2
MALPALRAIARATEAPLLFWGPPAFDELLSHTELRFDYLPYRRRPGVAGVRDALHAVSELRSRHAEAALLLPNAFEPALLARLAGIPRRIGYPTDGRGPLLSEAATEPVPRHAVHEADRFAHLGEYAGGGTPLPGDALLAPTEALLRRSSEVLPPGDHLGIVAGSANGPARRWPTKAYAELGAIAQQRWGAGVALLGSEADRAINAVIGNTAKLDAIDLSGCSLRDLMAALLRCRVVVSNDTGAAHLAAALGRPTVVLFGPTNPQRSAPRGNLVVALSRGDFCQPCGYRNCPLDHRCLIDLSPTTVLEAVEPFWQQYA